MPSVLTDSQQRAYEEQGYLLVSGLIPEEIALAAEEAIWEGLGAGPNDPQTWQGIDSSARVFEDARLVACYTPEFLAAAALLAQDDSADFQPPRRGYALNVFPQEGVWQWPEPHIDHAIKEHEHRTFPRAFRIAAMTYLNDVPLHGGGTVVWPRSHKQIEALAKSDPVRYEFMWALNQALDRAGLNAPVELTPRRGDILFYHCLCAHAGSMNVSARPRLALNMKW